MISLTFCGEGNSKFVCIVIFTKRLDSLFHAFGMVRHPWAETAGTRSASFPASPF